MAQGVSVGPLCTIGPSAKLGNGCQMHPSSHIFGNTKLGSHCVLMTGAVVGDDLPGRTVIGCNNIIGHHAVVGIKCQDMKYKLGDECFLDIGDNNEIREFTSIHRSSKSCDRTVIGDNNLIMGSCHIAHDCKIGNNNICANSSLLAGHVIVEIWEAFLLYVPCSGPFVILLLKIVVEYANSDNGAVLESIARIFYMTTVAFLSFVLYLWHVPA
ncbi:Acyl-[acyl-carrier-protein]--UDP-N-acetylglucosamine O-acyltransferase [Gossypium arboreum]|uniref:Acyl-[acyl-carrier-protein]--UDP-N-acetylglucosamine O-acyltransferase n=1 Tax=Gossypium arboreum TaxID=29729 RepID=A0A0B0MHB6_GOSAR|nr:Acyl-[acyl-carrier-protein]--UDP-N-acetylglucosamine O-acyltransferase [Gossypium arboreum]